MSPIPLPPFLRLSAETCQTGKIFADDVEFDVDLCAYFDVSEVGVFECVWNYGYAEGVLARVAYCEAYAVDCHRSFFDGTVSLCSHGFVYGI